ncbi:interactor of constitutive active ROPs 4-like isoform X1 [Nicotiana tabacum]|uniref:Interactor of constitutive active ROPs 4-like isoform X1 n=2 Tax=Nicotiana tabacum TaxID=4097 RepID=A0AC58TKN1_TOBAC|nr:interactor of constitutive active ROPs 4-like isoform X1 [Nicotiana tomentosiformis]XP_016454747.1 PREDICTED: interactor of constitutive active ROPs 4-like isoform X1 [Nicotiana tabacum]XP_033512761.1 interactor of constitutive active ROPs 4-like isoform X1 [Nicotiana tomentosiformis]
MPRSRVSDMAQRQSPRGPLQLRTSSSDSDQRTPKLGNHRSPRGAQSDPLNQRKLGTRIADLDSQLGKAQEELKNLKQQLTSVEAAKQATQEQLEIKTKKPTVPQPEEIQEPRETDVFEVSLENVKVEPQNVDICNPTNEDELKITALSYEELDLKNEEISLLKAKLEEKEKELQVFCQENENLKKEVNEKTLEISSNKAKAEEMNLKFNQVIQELETSKSNAFEINEKLEASEKAKEELESEMKKLRVQTEQWRKAADAAAAVLAGEVEMNGRRLSERCGSMDYKRYGNVFEPEVGGYGSYMGYPEVNDDSDDGFGHVKRKGSGIKMFGDLWRKKSQK